MKRYLSLVCLLLSLTVTAFSAEQEKKKANNNPAARQYMLSVAGVYGYNSTWGHHGGGLLRALMPVNPYVELTAAVSGLSSNTYTLAATARPKFPLPVGELYIDATVFYNCMYRARVHDIVGAGSLGYRMDYVNVQVGCFNRTLAAFDRQWHDTEEYMAEPFNLLYRLSFNVRPLCERWNIFFGMANFDDMQYERMWQPLFFLNGYYDFRPNSQFDYVYHARNHFRLLWEVTVKPTGMFHLDASFYGAQARFGFAYKF